YLTPIRGGRIADKYIGSRMAVIIGAVLMTLGHAAMATEDIATAVFGMEPSAFLRSFLYVGLGFLILGNGFFKPNMTSIISKMYEGHAEKKDGAYTIFYMGVNAGAFLGILLVGYVGEMAGWGYGFGLAGIFMFLGMLQFYFAKAIFGNLGDAPTKEEKAQQKEDTKDDRSDSQPFTRIDTILIALAAILGVSWIINDPYSKITGNSFFNFQIGSWDGSNVVIVLALFLFVFILFSRVLRYRKIVRNRMFAIMVFAFFVVFFWGSFEQAGGSMTIFAKDYTQRILTGNTAMIFNIVNIIITIVPIGIITWVLFLLFKQTFGKYALSNIFLGISFSIIWLIVFWMISNNLNTKSYEVAYDAIASVQTDTKTGEEKVTYKAVSEKTSLNETDQIVKQQLSIRTSDDLNNDASIFILDSDKKGTYKYITADKLAKVNDKIKATVIRKIDNEIEVPASWFGILNSLFIIVFAPLFSKIWESKFNPSATVKYGIALILLGTGFLALAYGSSNIPQGAKTASVSMIWLIIAYFLHTMGELSMAPVSLSYISKLVPAKMIAFMFGVWYLAIAIANKSAGYLGGMIDQVTEAYDLSTFFLIFTFIPIGMGIVAIFASPFIKKLMHGVK
ncbi:MAG: MFS transporter, partial [Flavobacteriaceae bacterium]|nr:MFS transporter [Flavobacteriaceae bacterium]